MHKHEIKKECSRLSSSGCQTKGGNSVYFFLKKYIPYINPNNKSKVTRKFKMLIVIKHITSELKY